MPEGDTIFRTAEAVRAAIGGQVMLSFEAPRLVGPKPGAGSTIESVESYGKHLEIVWSDGIALRTHMRMVGSWHIYRAGERWRMPRHQMRVAIRTAEWEAVCFRAPEVETYRVRVGAVPQAIARLGPDLIREGADLAECVERLRRFPDGSDSIAEVLLDQRVANGVGNVFKSEVLFACRVDPFAAVSSIDDETARRLIATVHQMLLANRHQPGRVTTTVAVQTSEPSDESPATPRHRVGDPPLAVYGRAGKPCLTCQTPVEMRHHGRHARSTYWCPTCQTNGSAV